VAFTQRQIDKYVAAPERRFIDSLDFDDRGTLEGDYKMALAEALQAAATTVAAERADPASHFTIVFGLGLGLHVEPLIEISRCVEMIIVEPNFDNLFHSLFTVDWRALFETTARDGRAIHLVLETDQDMIASHLRRLVRLGNPSLLDGVYIYQHYGSALLTEARLAFHRDLSLHVLGLGYFEDELIMMANAVGNLKRDGVRILAATQPPRPEPVIICGSGPSIDSDLPIIAAQRARVVIVSMGSSLRTLLAHGIRPDIHVETENHPLNAAGIERVAQEFSLDGITLLAASTVQPVVTELFDEVILYFRDRQSPASVFAESIEHMGSSGPTVANAALVTLLHLGFRELYLFGVDMGSRQADHYHSSGTYIGRGESTEWARGTRLPVPANFGGDVAAEAILNWSRAALENVLKLHRDMRCINCSDGARIAGTTPMLPRVVALANAPFDHAAMMAGLRGRLPVMPLELTREIWQRAAFAPRAAEGLAAVDEILAAAADREDPGLSWLYELYDLLTGMEASSPPLAIFLFGTTCLFLGTFWWFDGRINDAQGRCRFRRAAVRELRRNYAAMARRLDGLAADVERCLDGELARVDARFAA